MYATIDELKLAIGFQVTAMASGKTEEAFDSELTTVLSNACDAIDGMISPRVDPSTVSANAVLKRIALSVARYDVYCQYARNEVPETVREDKRDAMKQLEAIQTGRLGLSPDTPDEDSPGIIESEFTGSAQVFNVVLM